VVIVGGGVDGCAATLSLLENGCRLILTEEFAWIGGGAKKA
jgi:NADPH-dependent 2,4-dienoyl-CoA reductase/sulfur reductase-like enzyme